MKAFAILRHAKIKGGRHLVSVGLHNGRGAPTPNALEDSAGIRILVGTNKPHRDVMTALANHGITCRKQRKDANVAIEVFAGASPEWWAAHGWNPGVKPEGELLDLINDWASANLEHLRQRFGDKLVSAQLHLDEATPHIQALAIPVWFGRDGREKEGAEAWRLSTEKLIRGPHHLKQIQTEYAKAMERFGLRRGEDRETGTVWHKPLKTWQLEQHELARKLGDMIVRQIDVTKEAEAKAEGIVRKAYSDAAEIRRAAEKEAEEAKEIRRQAAELKRRADETATRDRHDAEVERQRIEMIKAEAEKEREEAKAEKTRLMQLREAMQRMIAEFDGYMAKIRGFALQFMNAKGPLKQAMELNRKGPQALEITQSDEVARLEAMRRRYMGPSK